MKKQNTLNKKIVVSSIALILSLTTVRAHAHDESHESSQEEIIREHEEMLADAEDPFQDDFELLPEQMMGDMRGCQKANSSQMASVNLGNSQRTKFQSLCVRTTGSSSYCSQVERPNPSSKSTFACTYGVNQPHRLIHPNSSTWAYATTAISLLKNLTAKGICVSYIYNWWRPEPYNANVGGAAGRHPYGTSIDVRFCSNNDAIKAFDELCKVRKTGKIRALGYYGSTGVHIGVGDKTANTWGRSCL